MENLEFNIREHCPAIIRLNVHLENQEYVYFEKDNIRNRINNPKDTQLTGFLICVDKIHLQKH